MNHSNEPFDESLLSAYLDNELSDAERLLVETKLASDASVRKLLSELASIRTWVAETSRETTTVTNWNGPWNAANLDSSGLHTSLPKPVPAPMQHLSQHAPWMWTNARWVASLAALILVLLTTGYLWNGRGFDRQNRISKSTESHAESSANADAFKEQKAPSDQASAGLAPTDPMQQPAAPMAAEPMLAAASDEPVQALRQNVTLNLQDKLLKELGNDQALGDVIQKALEAGLSTNQQSSAQMTALQATELRSNLQQALQDFIPIQPPQAGSALADSPAKETEVSAEVSAEVSTEVGAIVIELLIPKDNWEEGAKRLLELGVPVSMQLPSAELLEYNFVTTSMKDSNPSDSKDLRQETPSLSFEFRSPPAKKSPASDRDSQLNAEAIVAETVEPIALGTEAFAIEAPARELVLAWQYRSRVADAGRSMAKQAQDQVDSYVRIRLHVHK
jgi:hypothetical protein